MKGQINARRLNALEFRNAGLCIVPLRLDGSKASMVPWKQFQRRQPTPAEIEHWFLRDAGAAIVCGVVSGGLEVLDFDLEAETIFPAWAAIVDSILIRLPVVETPSGGFHVYYRCREVCRNQRIAMPLNGGKPFIESRGERGYITTVISPPSVHTLNYEYIQVAGPVLPDIPTITPDERKTLWVAAASFDQSKLIDKHKGMQLAKWKAAHQPRLRSANADSARKYVCKMESAISGSGGHNRTFHVACVLVGKFGLGETDALALLHEYNARCDPPWNAQELQHKISDAIKQAA